MSLLFKSLAERDFVGGIYLPALGDLPPVDKIESFDYQGELLLPLRPAECPPMELTVEPGQRIHQGQLLAQSPAGHRLFAPHAGLVGDISKATVHGRAGQPVLMLIPNSDTDENASQITPELLLRGGIQRTLEQAGIMLDTGESISRWYDRTKPHKLAAVVANATPLEPMFNTPLAIMHSYNAEVFTGLAILKKWFQAQEAYLTYPEHFNLNTEAAAQWEVECLPVSEKYPQGRGDMVLRTLQRQRVLDRKRHPEGAVQVFGVQLLRQITQILLHAQLPTHRIVTICGDGIRQPRHFEVPIGTPLAALLEQAGLYTNVDCIVEGAMILGTAIDAAQSVIGPRCDGCTVIKQVPQRCPTCCMKCGWCIDDCPARINPAQLYESWQQNRVKPQMKNMLDRCIECGVCSYLCPCNLPILSAIRTMKKTLGLGQINCEAKT